MSSSTASEDKSDIIQNDEHPMLETVVIDKLVHGGEGLGRLASGEIVFVPGAIPGETVEVRIGKGRGKTKRGEIQQVVDASEFRVPVDSPSVECDWEHIALGTQREWKQRILEESLRRVGGLTDIELRPMLVAPDDASARHYRNKVRIFVEKIDEQIQLGYHAPRTNDLVPLTQCLSMPPRFLQIVRFLEAQLTDTFALEAIQLRCNDADEVVLTLYGDSLDKKALETIIEGFVKEFPDVVGVDHLSHGKQFGLFGRGYLVYTYAEKQFQVSSPSFFQVNLTVLPLMMDVLGRWLPTQMANLVDLYAGVGMFAVTFSERAGAVLAIEQSKMAVSDAGFNMERNQASNVAMQAGDVRDVVRTLDEDFDVAILDPPRSGCHKDVLAWVNNHVQEQVIYISCDPATLARDLAVLTAEGWVIDEIQPVDMFPQTHHIETLVNLKRG